MKKRPARGRQKKSLPDTPDSVPLDPAPDPPDVVPFEPVSETPSWELPPAPKAQQEAEKALLESEDELGHELFRTYQYLKDRGRTAVAEKVLLLARAIVEERAPARKEKPGFSLMRILFYRGVEEAALYVLPFLFLLDPDTYLGKPWVQKLISYWIQRGERDKIQQAFFGPRQGKRGEDNYKTVTARYRRDLELAMEVRKLIAAGDTERAACRKVAEQSKQSNTPLAMETVKERYRRYLSEDDSLLRLFLPK